MSRVVLITGVSRFLGRRLAAELADDPTVDRIIGIDTVPPRPADGALLGRTEFVRADIRNPLIAKVLAQARVSTVVLAGLTAAQRSLAGRTAMQEMNVVGTMQLLAACQRSETVTRVAVTSTAAVYGAGPGDPAVFAETTRRPSDVRGGYARDAAEIEGYVRGFARRRPDVSVCVLRLAPMLGPTVDTALTRYLSGPVVPTVAGFDPRLQLVHEDDAVQALRHAAAGDHRGPVNVAGDGVVGLSQAIRRLGRARLPVPAPLMGAAGALVGNSGVADVLAADPRLLDYGRALDTTVLRTDFGYVPRHTTAETLETFGTGHRAVPKVALLAIAVGSRVMQGRSDDRVPVISGS